MLTNVIKPGDGNATTIGMPRDGNTFVCVKMFLPIIDELTQDETFSFCFAFPSYCVQKDVTLEYMNTPEIKEDKTKRRQSSA